MLPISDRYQLGEVLGRGGSGIVYAAEDAKLGALAVKVMRADLELTAHERRRFLAEADLLARVDHPHIVKVVDAGVLPDGRPFLAMPRHHGETLSERLERAAPLPLCEALAYFRQIGEAVAALHAAGVVHGDLKPQNVLLVGGRPGRLPSALLLDLGIANSTPARDDVILGTPAYMAPERFGGAPASERSDVYELAVLLYAMLVGQLPWAWCDAALPSAREKPARPAAAGVALPAPLTVVLLRALAARPDARPASAHEFVCQIADAAQRGGVPTVVHAPSRARARVAAPGTTVNVVLALIGLLGVVVMALVLTRPGAAAAVPVPATQPVEARIVSPVVTPVVTPLPVSDDAAVR